MASSSSVSVFDNYRFKSALNEELYNSIVKNKKVIAECCIDLDEDVMRIFSNPTISA
ncbi:hypothetical protein PIB30_100567, partial [Stylosanthes scabra]|nr:hypothetical protein [Stylosanthes scabra]